MPMPFAAAEPSSITERRLPDDPTVGALRLIGLEDHIDLSDRITTLVEDVLAADQNRIETYVRIDATRYLLYLRNKVEDEAQFDANMVSEEIRSRLRIKLGLGPEFRAKTIVLKLPLLTVAGAIGVPDKLLTSINKGWEAKKEQEKLAALALQRASLASMRPSGVNVKDVTYATDDIDNALSSLTPGQIDDLPFGVIKITRQGTILLFNANQGALANLNPQDIIGRNFFRDVAPCTNRREFLGRFVAGVKSGNLDVKFNYLFDFRMRPTRVSVHLKKSYHDEHYWILIEMVEEGTAAAVAAP